MAKRKAKKSKPSSKTSGANTPKVKSGLIERPESYVKVKSASGNKSYDCGDRVAAALRGKTIKEILTLVKSEAKKRSIDVAGIDTKYNHLNTGMQRMVLGNKLRAILGEQRA